MITKILDLLSPQERRRAWLLLGMILVMALLDVVGVASIMPFMAVLASPGVIETNPYLNALYTRLNFTEQAVLDAIHALGHEITIIPTAFVHAKALVDAGARIGARTRVQGFSHVLGGARIGADCNICEQVFIENDVIVGDRVTVKCGVQLWDGLRVGDDVHIGPNVTFLDLRAAQKDVEAALKYAEAHGWRVEVGGSHAWGKLYCPYNDEQCRCGDFCITSIWSTPKNPVSHARMLRRVIDNCTTDQQRRKTDVGKGD